MRILAFDCALEARSAALFEGQRLVGGRQEAGPRRHAERLLPLITETLAAVAWRFADLDLICLTRGPGSFTGLRIGLAAARGLAVALDVPVLGLSTLEALAAGVEAPGNAAVLALIDARRGQLYAQAFAASGGTAGPPETCRPEAVQALMPPPPVLLVGSGVAIAHPYLGERLYDIAEAPALPEAARFGRLAAGRAGEAIKGDPPEPLYLRAPDADPVAARR